MSEFRIGILTSGWDAVAWDLVRELIRTFSVAFVFCSREEGETGYGDHMIRNVRAARLPLVIFSSARFKPELRKANRRAWRLEHDQEVMKLLPKADLLLAVGYMWVVGEEMCKACQIINLHPALPWGPKGTYREVIWQLIREGACETGVMMHLVTEELDLGPPIAFCRLAIRGGEFDPLWNAMEARLRAETLEAIIAGEGDKNPLFGMIRELGVARELPLMAWTIRVIRDRLVSIDGTNILGSDGRALDQGFDLTTEIDSTLKGANHG